MFSFIEKNNSFFELKKDENGEYELDNKYGNRPERYLINSDFLYQVGDSLHKILDDGIVVSHLKYNEVMKENAFSIEYYKNYQDFRIVPNYVSTKSGFADCGTSHTWRSDNGNERLKVVIEVNNNGHSSVTCSFLSRPYVRVWPIWYQCSRSMKASVDLKYRYMDVIAETSSSKTWGWVSDNLAWSHDWATTDVYFEDNTSSCIWVLYGGEANPRFNSYKVWADTDKVAPIDVSCNYP